MRYEISRHVVPDQTVLAIREHLTDAELPGFIGRSLGELYGSLQHLGITGGEPFVIYHAFGPDGVDAEACVPVTGHPPVHGAIAIRMVEGGEFATTLHVGPYERLGDAYAALSGWVAAHGLSAIGPVREHYLDGPGGDPTTRRTLIEMPIHTTVPVG